MMSAPLEHAHEEIHAVIRYLQSKNKCAVEIYQEIVATYGSYGIDVWNVCQWVLMLDKGQKSIFDDK